MRSIWCCYFVLTVGAVVHGYHQDPKDFAKDPWRGIPMVCSTEDPKNTSISCHGVRIVKRVIQQLLESAANVPSIEITEGISLVESTDGQNRRARNMKNSILGFLEDRELRVKLPSLLPGNFEAAIKESLPRARGDGGSGLGSFGGGGGKKGDNSFMILALMMGKYYSCNANDYALKKTKYYFNNCRKNAGSHGIRCSCTFSDEGSDGVFFSSDAFIDCGCQEILQLWKL